MVAKKRNFDEKWNELYASGERHNNRYPFNSVIQFLFYHSPANKNREDIRILEVGCGAGNNLWFAAREGFNVFGVDASKNAVDLAVSRLNKDGLNGDIRVSDATELPFDKSSFDLVIDRAALTHMPKQSIKKSIQEIRRVLKKGGKFHFNPFGDRCSSAQRDAHDRKDRNGNLTEIVAGCLVDSGMASVCSKIDVEEFFRDGWDLFYLTRVEYTDMSRPNFMVHEEWIAHVEKV